MLSTVKNIKNHAKAFVDSKNKEGPAPSCLAMAVVSPSKALIGDRVPRFSETLNGTWVTLPSISLVLVG